MLIVAMLSLVACVANRKPDLPETSAADAKAATPSSPAPNISFEQMVEMEQHQAGSYLLGPGDTITISVYGEESLTRTVTIEPNGRFTFPLIGEIEARDKRVGEIIKEMDDRLSKYLAIAKTDITINEFSSNQVVLLGEGFEKPGTYTISGDMRIIEAIALAGGLRTVNVNEVELPGADLRRAYLARGESILPIDFEALLTRGDMKNNIRLRPKDILYVPLLTSTEVFVLGSVNSAKAVPLHSRLTLTKAITLAGGFTINAKITKVRIVRTAGVEREVFYINLKAILQGSEPDFELQANDIVFVEERVL